MRVPVRIFRLMLLWFITCRKYMLTQNTYLSIDINKFGNTKYIHNFCYKEGDNCMQAYLNKQIIVNASLKKTYRKILAHAKKTDSLKSKDPKKKNIQRKIP